VCAHSWADTQVCPYGLERGNIRARMLRPDLEGELLRRAMWHMMDINVRTNRHGALKRHIWLSAEDGPLQASSIRCGRGEVRVF